MASPSLAVVGADLSGRVTRWSAGAEALFGWAESEVLGRSLGCLVPGARPDVARSVGRLAAGGPVAPFEARRCTRSGGLVDVEVHITAVDGAAGPAGLLVVYRRLPTQRPGAAHVDDRSALLAEEARSAVVLDAMPVVVFSYDQAGRCTFSRGQALEHVGVSHDELLGTDLIARFEDLPVVREQLLSSLRGDDVSAVVELADRVWECHYRPVRDDDKAVVGGVGIAVDVTDHAEARQEVQANEARLRALLSHADDVVLVVNPEGRLLYVSPAVTRVLGYDDRSLFWRSAGRGTHSADQAVVADAWSRVLRSPGASVSVECRVRHADGSWRWCEHVLTNLTADPDVAGVVINLRDVTESRRVTQELQRLALHDGLTGLANRGLILDRIEQALHWGRRNAALTGLVVLDVVGMSGVNEHLGADGGDAVLRALAQRLESSVREVDGVARIGGDTFAVLVEDVTSTEEVRARAALLLEVADEPVDVQGRSVSVRLRAGFALSPAEDAGALLAAAERAACGARAVDRVVRRVRAATRRSAADDGAVAELREAITGGQLRLSLQPLVELGTASVVGVEALVRWEHPQRGLLMPSEFVPLAEENGLVVELGAWVLRKVCQRAASWQAEGRPLSVSVNLSPRQLVGRSFPDLLRTVLAETGARAEKLVLEVTESALMDDAGAPALLRELSDMGVRIALDDFGTGYSSLTYLRRFPVHAIKIDRSFVAGLGRNSDDEAIVASVVSLARAVGKVVVAEGVETAQQHAALLALGVDQAQGFYWSPALPADDLETWLARRRLMGAAPPVPPVRPGLGSGRPAAPVDDDEEQLLRLHEEGASLHTIAAALNAEGRRTPAGPRWTTTTVARVIAARSARH
jgi:diguanylate cyclase (GGDEF)-like protein/PAS domain S-box-containing protein